MFLCVLGSAEARRTHTRIKTRKRTTRQQLGDYTRPVWGIPPVLPTFQNGTIRPDAPHIFTPILVIYGFFGKEKDTLTAQEGAERQGNNDRRSKKSKERLQAGVGKSKPRQGKSASRKVLEKKGAGT